MADGSGSSPQKGESDPGSPESERLKQLEQLARAAIKQVQEENQELRNTLQDTTQQLKDQEYYSNDLERQLDRANQEKEAAMKQVKEVISSNPPLTVREKEELDCLRRKMILAEEQTAEHDATLDKSIKLGRKVEQLESQLEKTKEEIEKQKEKVWHEQKTNSDYQKMLAVANRKTTEIERKYDNLNDMYDRREEDFANREKQFEKKTKALQTKHDVQVEQNKTLDTEKKQAEILNANLQMQVQTLADNLKEAEAKNEQNYKDVADIMEKAQSTRESSPSGPGGGGGGGGLEKSLAAELNDAASSQGSVVSSIEDQANDFATKALDELQQKASGLEADNTKLRGEVASLQKEVSVLKEERDRLQTKLSALQEENNGLQQQNDDLAGERDGLQTKTSKLEQSNNKLQDEVAYLKKEAIDLNAEKDGLQRKATDLANDADKVESELRAEKDKLQEQISQLQEENVGLQKRVSELGSEAGKLEGELKAENDRLQKQVSDVQAQNDEFRKGAAELADDTSKLYAESKAEKERLRDDVLALQQQNEELQEKASGLVSGSKKLQDELAETVEALETAKEDRDGLRQLQDQRNEANKELSAANDQLEAELEHAREDAKQNQTAIAKLEAENRNMQAQMADFQEIGDHIEALQEERDKLQRELQDELDAKTKAVDQVAKAQDQGSSEAVSDSYEKVVSDLLQSKADLVGQIGAMEENRKKILEELEAVRRQLAAAPSGEDVQKLRDRLQELQKEREQLVADIRRLEREKGDVEDLLAERDALPSNEYMEELRREIALSHEAREKAERERDDQTDELTNLMGEKLDVEAKISALERARDARPTPEDLEAQAQQTHDLEAQVDELKAKVDELTAKVDELNAQLEGSKAKQDDYQERHEELLDDERVVELDLNKIRDAANSTRTADLDPADALRERIAAPNAQLDEARQEREDARREAQAGEPAEVRRQEANPIPEQLLRELAEMERTHARQEEEMTQRQEKKRQEKGKDKAGEELRPIPDEREPGEEGGDRAPSALDLSRQMRDLELNNKKLETAVKNELTMIDDKDRQIKDLQSLVAAQAQPEGPPPPPPGDEVLAVPRADVPGAVRERNRGLRHAFSATLHDVRALLTARGILQVRTVASQPRVVLFALYATIFALLGMIIAEGYRFHHWAVANDISRAMYVNRNWYFAIVLPDMYFWEYLIDLVQELGKPVF